MRLFARARAGARHKALSAGMSAAPPGDDAFEDFRLRVGDGFAGSEEFQMRRRDGRDQRHMRPHEADQRANLAEMIHADFEHAVSDIARHRREAERHAPVIVVGRGRGMGAAQAHRSASRSISLVVVFPALPVTAMILRVRARARGARQIFQTALGVGDRQQRRRSPAASGIARDQRRARLRSKRSVHEIMAVARVALQRHEQIAGLERARVDGKSGHCEGVAGRAQGGGFRFLRGPQRVMRARPPSAIAALIASSRSENGRTSLPTIWPVSWPLPAMTRHIAAFKRGNAGADGLRAVADFARARRSRRESRGGWWRRSSLRGLSSVTMTSIGQPAAASPISGRLPLSRSPPQPNTTCSLFVDMRTQRLQHLFQRVRRMGVIDIDRRADAA